MQEEFRPIIRITGTNLAGDEKIYHAITGINGVGVRLAKVIVEKADLDPETRLGFLSEGQVKKIEEILENHDKYGIPAWFFNRQKDQETGRNRHLFGPELVLQTKADIDYLKRTKSWRGYRHTHGLKVRGQRTRTSGRRRKTVGVRKKRERGS